MSSPLGAKTHEERRTIFLETAACLFEAKGYADTSIDDITRELGLSKSAFYHYWNSKEDLLEEISDRALRLLHGILDRLDEETNPYGTRLEATVAAYIDSVLENKYFVSVLLRDFVSSNKTREKRRAYMQRCREAVEEEIAAGNVRQLDPQMLTLALAGLCTTIAKWYEPGGRLGPEEIKEIFLGLATRGFLPLPEGSPNPGQSGS